MRVTLVPYHFPERSFPRMVISPNVSLRMFISPNVFTFILFVFLITFSLKKGLGSYTYEWETVFRSSLVSFHYYPCSSKFKKSQFKKSKKFTYPKIIIATTAKQFTLASAQQPSFMRDFS